MSAWLAACAPTATTVPDSPAGAVSSHPSAVTVKLIGINDFHGHLLPPDGLTEVVEADGSPPVKLSLGGVAYLASEIRALKAANPLNVVVGAGDLISASQLQSALFNDEPAVDVLNALGLDLSSVGNHEFDKGRDALLRMQRGGCAPGQVAGPAASATTCLDGRYPGAKFQWLAANVIDDASGRTLLPAYDIKTLPTASGPVRIAFIGLVLKDAPTLVAPAGIRGLRFTDEADTVNALVPQITAQGVRSIVVLIHQGGYTQAGYNDEECSTFTGDIVDVVKRLDPAVDAVISAHTHRTYRCRLPSRDPAHRILVTSAGHGGRFVTDIDLTIDPASDEVLDSRARNIPIVNDRAPNPAPDRYPTLVPDAAIAAKAAFYAAKAAPVGDTPVARLKADLLRKVDAAGETALGYVIADAQLASARDPALGGAQLALMNRDGVRADLLRRPSDGQVNFGQIYTAQPFGSDLVTMTLSGAQLIAVLEQQWRMKDGRLIETFLHPSAGFRYRWSASAPVGARIVPGSVELEGEPVQPERTYRVNVNRYLADGGDGFTQFLAGSDRVTGVLDRDALIAYLKASEPVDVPKTGRVTRVD